jgi:hypothetical protein
MAPGTWIASGDEYTVALASGVAYCSRSRIFLRTGKCESLPLAWYGSGRGK